MDVTMPRQMKSKSKWAAHLSAHEALGRSWLKKDLLAKGERLGLTNLDLHPSRFVL
jgi:cell division inhibitor SulA